MTKTFTFGKIKNNNNTFQFNNSTNYSKILDNIILTDIIDKNKYLFTNSKKQEDADIFLSNIGSNKKTFIWDNEFINAAKFLTNYKKYKTTYNIPYIQGKMYTLSDGTPIVFYDDEIQIGFDTYKYADFNNLSFLNNLSANKKKIIINIYTAGATDININLL